MTRASKEAEETWAKSLLTKIKTKSWRIHVELIPKVHEDELPGILKKIGCKLEHTDWQTAREEAKMISGAGGVKRAILITRTTKILEISNEVWDNEKMVEHFGMPTNYITKKEAKKL